MSNRYYFVASLKGRGFVQGIPVYAITEGDSYARGWTSNGIDSKGGIKDLANRISGSRQFSLAVPQIYANKDFGLKQEFDRLNIYAYYLSSNPLYMFGVSIVTVFDDIQVWRNQPINGWNGLPEPKGAQRKYLEQYVQNWSLPVGITLSVKDGQVRIVDNTSEHHL